MVLAVIQGNARVMLVEVKSSKVKSEGVLMWVWAGCMGPHWGDAKNGLMMLPKHFGVAQGLLSATHAGRAWLRHRNALASWPTNLTGKRPECNANPCLHTWVCYLSCQWTPLAPRPVPQERTPNPLCGPIPAHPQGVPHPDTPKPLPYSSTPLTPAPHQHTLRHEAHFTFRETVTVWRHSFCCAGAEQPGSTGCFKRDKQRLAHENTPS